MARTLLQNSLVVLPRLNKSRKYCESLSIFLMIFSLSPRLGKLDLLRVIHSFHSWCLRSQTSLKSVNPALLKSLPVAVCGSFEVLKSNVFKRMLSVEYLHTRKLWI